MSTTTTTAQDRILSNLLESDNFTVSSYLNKALNPSSSYSNFDNNDDDDEDENNDNDEEKEDKLQRRMAELAIQLQVTTRTCHDDIGRIGAELRAILPRCAADAGRLGVGLDGMADDVKSLLMGMEHHGRYNNDEDGGKMAGGGNIKADDEVVNITDAESTNDQDKNSNDDSIIAVVTDPIITKSTNTTITTPSNSKYNKNGKMTPLETLQTLSTLHALRSNLTHTKSILSAASSWDDTASTLPTLLSAKPKPNLSDAVSALLELEAGNRALSGYAPGRMERFQIMKNSRKNIEALLKPQLMHALSGRMENRLGPLQSCVNMYVRLGTVEVLLDEYVKSRPGNVHRKWFEFGSGVSIRTSSSGGGDSNNGKNSVSGSTASTAVNSSSSDPSNDLDFYDWQEEPNGDNLDEQSNTKNKDNDTTTTTTTHSTTIDTTTTSTSSSNNNNSNNNNIEKNTDSASDFLEWLPTWYESILNLLAEEKRRALAVFGSELASEVLARVLNECFRPILPSYKTRLTAIHPIDATGDIMDSGGGTTKTNMMETNKLKNKSLTSASGSFESICAAFEATLNFLSVAYEQIVEMESEGGGNIGDRKFNKGGSSNKSNSVMSNNNNKGAGGRDDNNAKMTDIAEGEILPSRIKSPARFHVFIQAIFVAIGSPFAPYQKNYVSLESIHSIMSYNVVAKDVRSVSSTVTSTDNTSTTLTLPDLQDTVERLTLLAPFVFPMAHTSLARFELLAGGYCATKVVSTVDHHLLSRHVREISIAIDTLSASLMMVNNNNSSKSSSVAGSNSTATTAIMENFDEQLVQCALEVLRLAGSVRKDFSTFDCDTKERIRVLAKRIHDSHVLQRSLMEIVTAEDDNRGGEEHEESGGGERVISGSSFVTNDINDGGGSLVPDSLSAVEVEVILARSVYGSIDSIEVGDKNQGGSDNIATSFSLTATPPSVTVLLRLAGADREGGGESEYGYDNRNLIIGELPGGVTAAAEFGSSISLVFPETTKAVSQLARTCRSFVFDVCSAIPLGELVGLPNMPVWGANGTIDEGGDDSYGTLPQSYITHVGEHVLSLVQALEPFSSDPESLHLASSIMGGLSEDEFALRPWREFAASAGFFIENNNRGALSLLMSGVDLVDHVLNHHDGSYDDNDESGDNDCENGVEENGDGNEEEIATVASAKFCNQWLDTVCSAVTGRFLERTMKIRRLGRKGSEHLSVDYNYLANVFSALGIKGHPHPLLNHIGELMKLDGDALREIIVARNNGKNCSLPALNIVRNIETRIALMRGVSVD